MNELVKRDDKTTFVWIEMKNHNGQKALRKYDKNTI